MTRGIWVLLAAPAYAHVVSMSSSDLMIQGSHAQLVLRMPLFEITHIPEPDRALLDNLRFSSSGRPAKPLTKSCTTDQPSETYRCKAEYEFAAPVETLDVECTFPSIIVPAHIHMLRATAAGKNDEALLDRAFTRATLRFRPATPFETLRTEFTAGVQRALGGAVQVLFLAALALAARSRKELAALFAMFLLGQIAAVGVVPRTNWQPAARFVESAAALTVAYFAVEILMLPKAGARWLVAGVLGVFHGLYFHLFLQASSYRPAVVLGGAFVAEAGVTAILAIMFSRIAQAARAIRPVEVAASALLVFGLVWFAMRLSG